jgi:hypothetical protein
LTTSEVLEVKLTSLDELGDNPLAGKDGFRNQKQNSINIDAINFH